jgi:O-antigen/teichoic acid export membrane protein
MTKIIRSVQKVFMPFGMSGNIYLFGAIGQGLGPVLLTPILTRVLDVKTFGEIAYVTSVAAVLGILFSLGLPIIISRSYVLDAESRPSILQWFKQIISFYLILAAILVMFVGNSILLSAIAMSFGLACMQLILPLARAQNKAAQFALISIIGTLLPSVLVIINSYFVFFSSALTALVLGSILGALVSSALIWTKSNNNRIQKKYSIINSVKSAYPILPHMFAMMALLNIDKIIFGQELDKTFSGYLQVIMLLGTAPSMILSALNHAWLNKILLELKDNSFKAFKSLNSTIARLFILTTLMISGIALFNSLIIELLNPNVKVNSDIQKTVVLTSISTLIYVVYLANTHLLTWLNRFWVLGITTPLSVIFQTIIIYLTIDSLGYVSTALAFGSALTVQVILLQLFRMKTETKSAIHPGFYVASLGAFWVTALLFVY